MKEPQLGQRYSSDSSLYQYLSAAVGWSSAAGGVFAFSTVASAAFPMSGICPSTPVRLVPQIAQFSFELSTLALHSGHIMKLLSSKAASSSSSNSNSVTRRPASSFATCSSEPISWAVSRSIFAPHSPQLSFVLLTNEPQSGHTTNPISSSETSSTTLMIPWPSMSSLSSPEKIRPQTPHISDSTWVGTPHSGHFETSSSIFIIFSSV